MAEPPPADPNLILDVLKFAQGLAGTVLGGGLVILGGWLADRRKRKADELAMERRERALLTAMFAVRNHIAERLNEYEESGVASGLEPLRTAQAYIHRLIDRAPGESESLMIAIIEIGLKIDALLAIVDRKDDDPALKDRLYFAKVVSQAVGELAASLEQFDIVAGTKLNFLTEEDLAQFSGFEVSSSDKDDHH